MRSRGKVEVLVFNLGHLVKALMEALSLWPPSLCLLGVDEDAFTHRCGRANVLVFNLADVAKALVHL
jgi:hypothetical protein